jgi:hypothetical protein
MCKESRHFNASRQLAQAGLFGKAIKNRQWFSDLISVRCADSTKQFLLASVVSGAPDHSLALRRGQDRKRGAHLRSQPRQLTRTSSHQSLFTDRTFESLNDAERPFDTAKRPSIPLRCRGSHCQAVSQFFPERNSPDKLQTRIRLPGFVAFAGPIDEYVDWPSRWPERTQQYAAGQRAVGLDGAPVDTLHGPRALSVPQNWLCTLATPMPCGEPQWVIVFLLFMDERMAANQLVHDKLVPDERQPLKLRPVASTLRLKSSEATQAAFPHRTGRQCVIRLHRH